MRNRLALALVAVAALAAAQTIEVTFGNFQGSPALAGRVSLVEKDGKRFADFKWTKAPAKSLVFRLVKSETLKTGAFPKDTPFVNLGRFPKSVPISKKLDVWLYRSIAAVDAKNQIVAFVHLRSAQEAGR
jgi:hypothetical protein